MSPSARAGGALLCTLALVSTGCAVAYVPSANGPRAAVGATDAASLKKLVRVLPQTCTAKAATGTVRNDSSHRVRIVIEAGWSTADFAQRVARRPVELDAGKTERFRVPAPKGATAQYGCQAYAATVTVVSP